MRAVVANDYGPPESYVVTDVPEPVVGDGQLKVRVEAASVNPADVRLAGERLAELSFPHVPGNDFAGVVVDVGSGVSGYGVGDAVFGTALPRVLRGMAGARPSVGTGSLAEYIVVEADTPLVGHRPSGLSALHAAAIATSGFTARAVQHKARVGAGDTVLVIGATGGTGTAVVPYLASAGAHVIATGEGADAVALKELGAASTVGYRGVDPVSEVLRLHPSGVDVVINLVLPGDDLSGVARAARGGGRVFSITFPPPGPDATGRSDVTAELVLDMAGKSGAMADVAADALAGRLPAVIGRRFGLEEGVAAVVSFLREHNWGKVLVG